MAETSAHPRRRRVVRGVIGVGASAGGLEALQKMFEHVPAKTGMAFVVVQHLSPDHKSMMVDLLSRHTTLPVAEISDGCRVEPDKVYLLPPGRTVAIAGDSLRLSKKSPLGGMAQTIDLFFESLAQWNRERIAAVILSGTGSDGMRGAGSIAKAGGLVIAQAPETAKFDGMPQALIKAGLARKVLAPEEIPGALFKMVARRGRKAAARNDPPADRLAEVASILRRETGVDFADYKPATLLRRIERRMQINDMSGMDDYLALLDRSPIEAGNLYKEMLIGVTQFFRDPGAFDSLANQVVPAIVERAVEHETIRAWVCGCATGEEAYSLAILFAEELARTRRQVEVKIFATDLDRDSIEAASSGVFDEHAFAGMDPVLKERYFIPRGGRYSAVRSIRQMIVFARHNILKDPPFTRVELVTCRNLLIYMEAVLQRRVLSIFHYALNHGGYMFLGSSESLGEMASDFVAIDAKHKIYQSRGAPVPSGALLPGMQSPAPSRRGRAHLAEDDVAIDQGMALLIDSFTPPALLVNERGELMHVFGNASRYLHMPSGSATLELARLLPTSMAAMTGSAIHKALRDGREIEHAGVPISSPDGMELVRVRVQPFTQQSGRRFALIVVEPQLVAVPAEPEDYEAEGAAAERIRGLEHDLKSSQESLQATLEELETANEELQAANEELLASNEELQSTNEELQSVNEELYTVNSEYEAKIEELTRLTDDLDNLFAAAELGAIFLDRELTIRRFTPASEHFLNLIARDLGRSIAHISLRVDYPDFMTDIEAVRDGGKATAREVRGPAGRWVLVRIRPYMIDLGGKNEHRSGMVVSFIDVTALKSAQRWLQAVLDSLPEQVAVLDHAGILVYVNRSWSKAAARPLSQSLVSVDLGADYLDFCRRYAAEGGTGPVVCAALREMLEGRRTNFALRYKIMAPAPPRAATLSAFTMGEIGIVLSHSLENDEETELSPVGVATDVA